MGAGVGGIGGMSSVVNKQDGQTVGYHTESLKAEPTIEEQIVHAKEVVAWLEKIWDDDEEVSKTIGQEDWEEFMKKIYEWVNELEAIPDI